MTLPQQALLAVINAPFAIGQGRGRFWLALAVYLACGLAVFGWVSHALIQNQAVLRQVLMDYLLPSSWHSVSSRLIDFFFASQTRTVLAGLILNTGLVLASVILFPLKEYCSARFEAQLLSGEERVPEFPLRQQALEETKLLGLYLALQMPILAIGYYPYPAAQAASSALAVLLLCFSFGWDLIGPTLQRHRYKYSSIIKLLTRNAALTFSFGAVFAVPLLLLGEYILAKETFSLAQTTSILMLLNLLVLAAAIPAGTLVAHRLLPEAANMQPLGDKARHRMGTVLMLALVAGFGFHTLLAISLHRKSQILKCEYEINWSTLQLDMPGWSQLTRGQQPALLQFDLQIHNPTPFDLEFEDSDLTLWQNKHLISTFAISGFSVPSGASRTQPMRMETKLNTRNLSHWRGLADGWTVQIQFDLLPGLPFVLQLI